MNPSRIFILRPVATSLLMFSLFLAGMVGLRLLPVSALPQVDYPTIQITTLYPGASPEVVSAIITSPLEKQFGQLSGLAQMSSTSAGGASTITLQFQLGLALDVAEQQVQQAINAASGLLPNDLPQPPIYNKVNPADAPIITLAVSSDLTPLPQVQEIIDNRMLPRLSQVLGVGRINIGGGKRPAVRISVDMNKLASHNLALEDLRTAITNANVNMAKGSFDGKSTAITIDANDQLKSIEEYRDLVISWKNSAAIRLGDLAIIRHAAENEQLAAWANNKEAIILNVQRQPGANVIATVELIKQLIPQLTESLPRDIKIEVLNDRTIPIKAAVSDVRFELGLSVILVILVVFVFIRRLWVTVIPSIALPLSLIATFAVMYLCGFSINNLSLMALTIATGFVIDDAIVMIDNISRHVEEGSDPLSAALNGSKQIGFTIISLTFSLVAVLIPLLFMADVVGRLFREFAITLAVAILLSAVVSLTLTPMMCAKLLKQPTTEESAFSRYIGNFFESLINRYKIALSWVLLHQTFTLMVAIASLILTILLYLYIPKGFFPVQDSGTIQAVSELRQSASFTYIHQQQEKLINRILADPAVANLSANIGVDASNSTLNTGRLLINLKDKSQRDNINLVMNRLQSIAEEIPGIKFYSLPVQDLTIEGRSSKTQYQFTLSAANWQILSEWSSKLQEKLQLLPSIAGVASDFQEFGRQAYIEINREQAGRLGISIASLDQTLYSAFGQRLISTIFNQTNLYRVVLEAQPQFKNSLESLNNLYLIASNGQRVPLSSIATVKESALPLSIERVDQFPAVTLSFNVKEGYSLSDAVTEIKAAATVLPAAIELEFQGAAKAFQASLSSTLWLILAAIITVYIVLGVLYESLIHPLTILSTLPTAALGALLALVISRQDLNIVAIIGIILLIGIVKKNAIIMIDFALEMQREKNSSAEEAIFSACIVRFRPILMTTMAAMLGALPLMLSQGAGSELRQPLGITMVGGLLVSQILTLFTVPVIFLWFDRLANKFK